MNNSYNKLKMKFKSDNSIEGIVKMKQHELKTDPEVFQLSFDGKKGYEIRFNDRDYKVGDRLVLKETRFSGEEIKAGKPLEYTGRSLGCNITSMVCGYGLDDGWVILGTNEGREQQASRIAELEEKLKATQNKNKEGINNFIDLIDHATKAPSAEQGILLLAGTVQKLRTAQPPQGESK